ncbi:MAG: DUF3696 domain-containing protein [Bacteroidota bacterium]
MVLQKLKIENFKCFGAPVEIEFGKITLLTGANSSGKSSVIYSILGAIQSGEFPYQFSTNGKYINMGDFKDVVFEHDSERKIKLGFEFKYDGSYKIETLWEINDEVNNLPKLHLLKSKSEYFNIEIKSSRKIFIGDIKEETINSPKLNPSELFEHYYINSNEAARKQESSNAQDSSIELNKYLYEFYKETDVKGIELIEIPPQANSFADIKLRAMLNRVSDIFTSYDEKINFISSFRQSPERVYFEQSKSKYKVNNDGGGYLDQILYWEANDKAKFAELGVIMKELNLLDSIKSRRMEGGRYEISVQTKEKGTSTSLSDVGFGVSQFMPIIVADLQLPKASTLYVAEPEIHLHPSVQSSFGDYLVKQVNDNDKNYVIETHSEYLLNKLRLAVVKGEIKEEDVKVMFIDNSVSGSVIHNVKFNKDGSITGAPDNFFKTYMMDVMDIAIYAAE